MLGWRLLAALLVVVGLVLSPLRAVAATVPMLIAYDAAVPHMPTVRVGASPSLRPEGSTVAGYVYDNVPDGHVARTKPRTVHGAGAVHAYDAAREILKRREPAEGATYDAPAPTVAAESMGGAAQGAGFSTFEEFKAAAGPAGPPGSDMQWHHLVEQNPANVARFAPEALHNTGNPCEFLIIFMGKSMPSTRARTLR